MGRRNKAFKGKKLTSKVSENSRKLKMLLNAERRVVPTTVLAFDADVAFSQANTALQCISLTQIGDTSADRSGNGIHIYKIHLQGYVHKFQSNSDVAYVRVLLIRARETGGNAVVSGSILGGDNSYEFLSNSITVQEAKDRNYTVVWDRKIALFGDSASSTSNVGPGGVQFEKVYYPPKTETTTYSGGTAAISNTQSNHYFVLIQQSRVVSSDVDGYLTANVFFNP